REEPCPAAEDQRDDVQLELVDEPSRQVLVDDVGAAADEHVLPASRVPCPVERRLDPVGHERERRVRERERLSLVMREHKHGTVEGRPAPPPPLPLVGPRPGPTAELPATHDLRADVLKRLLDHPGARVHLAALETVRLAPGAQRDYPIVQPLAAHAERILQALVWA